MHYLLTTPQCNCFVVVVLLAFLWSVCGLASLFQAVYEHEPDHGSYVMRYSTHSVGLLMVLDAVSRRHFWQYKSAYLYQKLKVFDACSFNSVCTLHLLCGSFSLVQLTMQQIFEIASNIQLQSCNRCFSDIISSLDIGSAAH